MIHFKGEPFIYNFLSASRAEIPNGVPYCLISNIGVEPISYWSGIEWQESIFHLDMNSEGEGLYSYSLPLDEEGFFLIEAYESYFDQKHTLNIEVVDADLIVIPKNEAIIKTHLGDIPQSKEVSISIKRESDSYSLNESGHWQFMATSFPLLEGVMPGVYAMNFSYSSEDSFKVTITEPTTNYTQALKISFRNGYKEKAMPGTGEDVNCYSVFAADGTSSILLNQKGEPVKDAEILIYDKASQEFFRCFSDKLGRWATKVTQIQTAVIMIKKEGLSSVSMERILREEA